MDGFSMMIEFNKRLLEQGEISKETAEKENRIYSFLAECEQSDFYRMFDTGAFNEIIKAYTRKALQGTGADEETISKAMNELRWIFDTMQANEVCE